jgi:hypothetical protein
MHAIGQVCGVGCHRTSSSSVESNNNQQKPTDLNTVIPQDAVRHEWALVQAMTAWCRQRCTAGLLNEGYLIAVEIINKLNVNAVAFLIPVDKASAQQVLITSQGLPVQ